MSEIVSIAAGLFAVAALGRYCLRRPSWVLLIAVAALSSLITAPLEDWTGIPLIIPGMAAVGGGLYWLGRDRGM